MGDDPERLQEAAREAFAFSEDAQRLSQAGESFREEKHHLFYSAARNDAVPRYVSSRAFATGDDVLSAVEGLAREYALAARALEEFVRSGEGMRTFPEWRRAETAFKSVHMWLRAYQDSACGVLLATRGDRVGAHTSMSDRLKPGKPVGAFLAERLPEYADWFRAWRDRRDQMKLGASFRSVIEGNPPRLLGFRFEYPRRQSPNDVTDGFVGLNDVIEGLEMSRRLTEVVRAEVEARRS